MVGRVKGERGQRFRKNIYVTTYPSPKAFWKIVGAYIWREIIVVKTFDRNTLL